MEDFDDKYRKKNPFTVPEGYFDRLPGRVMERVNVSERAKKKHPVRRFRPYMGWAAVFVGVLFMAQVVYMMAAGDRLRSAGNGAEYRTELGEDIFDSHFNPTDDEIIEYLVTEVEDYEWMFAGIY